MSVFDHSKTNWRLMYQDPNQEKLNNKINLKTTKIPLSQQNTIDKRSSSNYEHAFRDATKIQSKLESNLYKLEINRNEDT